ncbi:hypothetical protein CHLNCDRAFT_140686 [Chlorella variabilis]|uniref:ABC1 atypical kinase-like domain-containing protein n=1 Tax=Chlorella variabilis TaxID=554065 RepID=E1Z5Z0_CHLVA|nr:hypothetical protein CHLNCDRAFT_140686 [Chlorella variabilis]EFN58557.1 hypothetical protein CHLNCDRAFT_140686 [Chlorella variabilis]|eukprot:XP_005850659.1 hypothetical protein CHLNCDRAFT_140686 [Chlorella variabilis]
MRYKALAARYAADPQGAAYQQALAELHEHAASKLLLTIQANGGLYIKAGRLPGASAWLCPAARCQAAGQLAVSLNAAPLQYRKILEALQDRVPPRPFEDANRVLLQELGAPAQELFAEFEPLATAAASLAQVHKARMHDGAPVAVKVQYPGLESAVAADLATMLILSDAGHWLFPATSWRWLFEELQRHARLGSGSLQYELDFRNEATNAARLAECMAGRADVAMPRTMPQLCSSKVLTMEWVEGCRITDVECLIQQGLRPRDVGTLLLDTFAQQTYLDGFTHGDPHPGNLLVRPRPDPPSLLACLLLGGGPRPQLVLLDHGVYVTLPDHLRRLYCQLWCAIAMGDMHTARLAATELAGEKGGRILPEILRPRNWAKVSKEERQRLRQEAGVGSFADLAAVLTEAPKPLLDSLRQSAVVRHSGKQLAWMPARGRATLLGATLADRLRVNATWALRGMLASKPGQGPAQFVGGLQSRLSRWRLALQVGLLRLAFWVAAVVQDVTALVLPPLAA